jgi:hypothetical protein
MSATSSSFSVIDYVMLGLVVIISPLWLPFFLIGMLTKWLVDRVLP